MTNRFLKLMPFIFKWEGGYDNDPDDPGGETNYGIDRRSHPNVDIKNLTRDDARQIYWIEYWVKHRCGEYEAPLGEVFFNACVNCGPGRALKILRTHRTAPDYLDEQEAYYRRLVKATPGSQKFLKGWLNRTRDFRSFLKIPDGN